MLVYLSGFLLFLPSLVDAPRVVYFLSTTLSEDYFLSFVAAGVALGAPGVIAALFP
jgi:hypothetical protein